MAGVASAAIIEGQLIIGLDDGTVIRAGYVQGPQGLKGDPGPVGATGDRGTDGNTIHTVGGTPRNDIGVDGDYAIDNINWRIYGPKSGGVWGKAKEMLPGKEVLENGRTQAYSGATGGGGGAGGTGGGGPVFTSTVIATGTGRLAQEGTGPAIAVSYPGSPLGMISPESGMGFQSNINAFFVKALEELEVEIPVAATDTAPTLPQYEGKLWFDTNADELTLYVYYDGAWVPAAPPVSLDGINATIDAALIVQNELLGRVQAGETAQSEIRQDVLTLQQEIDALENTRYVGTWNAIDDASKNGRPPGDGNFYFNQGALATDWSLVGWIYIANVDSNGVTFTHNDIQVGDQIEVISKTENSYGIYTIQDATDAGDYVAIQIETMNRSDGTPATGAHLIKIFSIDTGLDLNDADDRYMKLRGNQQLDKDTTFRIRQNDLSDSSKTFIAINDGEMNLYHVADPGADTHAANQKYVNEQRDTRLALTGGTMTGDIAMSGNKVTGLGTPTADAQAANKGYVDEKIAAIELPDAGVQATDRIIAKPSRWKYKKNETLAENLNRGEFLMKKDNNEVFKIYLSEYNEFGNKWVATSSEYDWTFSQNVMFSISDYEGKIRYMAKIDTLAFNVGTSNYTRVELQFPKMHLEPLNDSRYLINIPGLLPVWQYSTAAYGTPT